MQIKRISEFDKEKYEELALTYGSIFNTYQWLKIFDNLSIYGIFDEGNNLIGGFHLFKERKFVFTIYHNPPFTPNIGSFLQVKDKKSIAKMDTREKILYLLQLMLKRRGSKEI
jgi:hypothetical protein